MATPKSWRAPNLSFGLVNMNVGVGTIERNGKVAGHKYCPDHEGTRVKQQWVCTEDDKVVEPISGYEEGDKMVILTKDEQAACKSDKTGLEVEGFVDVADIDPVYYEGTYNIWATDEPSIRSFNAVAQALCESNKAAVGKVCFTDSTKMFVLRWSERLATMLLHVCTFDANFKWDEIDLVQAHHAAGQQPSEAEIGLAKQIIELQTLDGTFVEYAESITDSYQVGLREAITAKAKGGQVASVKKVDKAKSTSDLTAQLQASVAAVQAKPKKSKARAA